MTVLPSLPVIDVYLAFNPTNGTTLVEAGLQALPASGASNTYWTNVSQFNREFDTKSGRQHFLDRVEAGTLNITFDNRSGYFFNGAAPSGGVDGNSSGYIIQTRMPIAITATWSAVTYPIFMGITESVQEQITDEVNVDLSVTASDILKYLSLCYMNRKGFWPPYANSASTQAWFDMGAPSLAVVTSASWSGTTVTYHAVNSLKAGENVTITGLGTDTAGVNFNLSNVTLATCNPDTFTVTAASHTANSVGTGNVYRSIIVDNLGGTSGNYLGQVSWPTYGSRLYDTNTCVDLTNGGSAATGYARFPAFSGMGGLDFWVLGQNIAGTSGGIIAPTITFGATLGDLRVSKAGEFGVFISPTFYGSGININDGYWHHVGVVADGSGVLHGYCDGTFFAMGSHTNWTTSPNLLIGASPTSVIGGLNAYVDDVVVSNTSSLSTLAAEVQQRYRAGSLLQLGFPVTPSSNAVTSIYTGSGNYVKGGVSSGDRIAEILLLAGFGSITGGSTSAVSSITLPSNFYYVNNTGWTAGESNGFVPVEPYYWDSPVTTSTALDLITQITDTDIGSFWQAPDGTVNYYNQSWYGAWSWGLSSTTLSIGTGSKTLTTSTGLGFTGGANVTLTGPGSSMFGTITSYTSGTLVVNVTSATGSGSAGNWTIGSWYPNSYSPALDQTWTDDDTGYAYEGQSLQVLRDDADIWTMVKISPQAGIEQIYENVAAEGRWGYSTLTKTATVHTSLSLALSTATFLGYLSQSELPRVQNVELSSVTANGGLMTAILGSWFGDVIEFKRTSPNASTSGAYPSVKAQIDQLMVLESMAMKFNSEKGVLTASFQLDPYILRGL